VAYAARVENIAGSAGAPKGLQQARDPKPGDDLRLNFKTNVETTQTLYLWVSYTTLAPAHSHIILAAVDLNSLRFG
jgi:hypothetical protein